jgi:hypothetical protein
LPFAAVAPAKFGVLDALAPSFPLAPLPAVIFTLVKVTVDPFTKTATLEFPLPALSTPVASEAVKAMSCTTIGSGAVTCSAYDPAGAVTVATPPM